MAFQQGLSGLNAAGKNLDAIGNNVANASTVGFKGSQAQFSDVYAASLSGAGAGQIGLGTKVGAVTQQFSQGNITATSNPLDIAINGGGFFRLDNGGAITYTRNGQFQQDKDGFLISANGYKVTGYSADSTGTIVATNPGPITISSADLTPTATGQSPSKMGVKAALNLDSRASSPVTAVFNPMDPNTYNNSTSATIYDSLGNSHVMSLYFSKAPAPAVAGTWNLNYNVDGSATSTSLGTLAFDSSGKLTTAMPLNPSITLANGAVTPQTFKLDFTGTSQYGSPFGVNSLSQDGFSSGRLNGFNVGNDGVIQGRYSNGQSRNLGQVVLANFINVQGLKPLGNNQWAESVESNAPLVGTPGSGRLGVLQSSSVEESNVDLTAELVNMITAQRVYQANAQSIKTQDAIMQTIVNLR
jgi:flagellar hook protein FlgE